MLTVVKNNIGIQLNGIVWVCRACLVQKLSFDPEVPHNGVTDILPDFSVSAVVKAKKHLVQHCRSDT